MSNAATIMRYGIVGVIWIGVLVLAIFAMVTGETNDGAIPISLAGFITAAIATGFLLNPDEAKSNSKSDAGKRKNDQSGGLDALSLLTPEDLEDLRQEVKDRLRERMLSGEDGELSSLDALLTDQRKRK